MQEASVLKPKFALALVVKTFKCWASKLAGFNAEGNYKTTKFWFKKEGNILRFKK
jgi:hypothetical protein